MKISFPNVRCQGRASRAAQRSKTLDIGHSGRIPYLPKGNLQNLARLGNIPVEPKPPPFRTLCLERLNSFWCDHEQARSLAEDLEESLEDALGRVTAHGGAVLRTAQRAGRREEEAQNVVDLGRGPDRGPGRTCRRLLLDRERGQDVLDEVHVGALEPFQILPRVRGHRFHEPALALGVERVERERRLPGAGRAGDDRERADGKGARHVLQVVRAGVHDRDRGRGAGSGTRFSHRENTASWFRPSRKRR